MGSRNAIDLLLGSFEGVNTVLVELRVRLPGPQSQRSTLFACRYGQMATVRFEFFSWLSLLIIHLQKTYTVTRYTPAGAIDKIDCQYLTTSSTCWHYHNVSSDSAALIIGRNIRYFTYQSINRNFNLPSQQKSYIPTQPHRSRADSALRMHLSYP